MSIPQNKLNFQSIMAKKTTAPSKGSSKKKSQSSAVVADAEAGASDTNLSVASNSSDDFSSDEELEMAGLEEDQSTKTGSHTVNIKQDKKGGSGTPVAKSSTIIYVGRLPKSFQEKELRKYFSQFGDISKVRVSRNKKTGASKNYAFVEFQEASVAHTAAETMNNYLLMGHLLRVSVLENHKSNIFSSKMKSSFREHDWRAAEYEQHNRPKPLATWKELQKKFEESKKLKFDELKALGFNYALET